MYLDLPDGKGNLDEEYIHGFDWCKRDLKIEAIKWIKYFESDDYFENMDAFSTSDPCEVSRFLKNFFDITEEDLK